MLAVDSLTIDPAHTFFNFHRFGDFFKTSVYFFKNNKNQLNKNMPHDLFHELVITFHIEFGIGTALEKCLSNLKCVL